MAGHPALLRNPTFDTTVAVLVRSRTRVGRKSFFRRRLTIRTLRRTSSANSFTNRLAVRVIIARQIRRTIHGQRPLLFLRRVCRNASRIGQSDTVDVARFPGDDLASKNCSPSLLTARQFIYHDRTRPGRCTVPCTTIGPRAIYPLRLYKLVRFLF